MANTTWNPSDLVNFTLSGGNLTATNSVTAQGGVRTVDRQRTGKYYWENTLTFSGANALEVGIANAAANLTNAYSTSVNVAYVWNQTGAIYVNSTIASGSTLGALTTGNTIGIALDLDAQRIWFRVAPSGNWNGSGTANPATNVGGLDISGFCAGMNVYPLAMTATSGTRVVVGNFGDSAFSGTTPAGFTAGFPGPSASLIAEATQVVSEQWINANAQAQATQVALEEWFTGSPPLWVTQTAIEHWASTASGTVQLLVTQAAIEHWASVAAFVPPSVTTQARAIILA